MFSCVIFLYKISIVDYVCQYSEKMNANTYCPDMALLAYILPITCYGHIYCIRWYEHRAHYTMSKNDVCDLCDIKVHSTIFMLGSI